MEDLIPRRFSLLLLALLNGCGAAGQRPVRLDLFATGTAAEPLPIGQWKVTLDEARVGLGPLYFCATAAASADLCPAAVVEFAAVATVDALDPSPQRLGDLTGGSGEVRSATYDFALSWIPRWPAPRVAATAPGGHSAHFAGRASRGPRTLRFVADVDVQPQYAGTRAVNGAPAAGTVRDGGRLEIALDPRAWWAAVDFDELASGGGDPVVIAPDSRAANAIVIGMTTAGQPLFSWSPAR